MKFKIEAFSAFQQKRKFEEVSVRLAERNAKPADSAAMRWILDNQKSPEVSKQFKKGLFYHFFGSVGEEMVPCFLCHKDGFSEGMYALDHRWTGHDRAVLLSEQRNKL